MAEWPAVEHQLAAALADAHEGLRFNIVLEPPNALPRFELKARRLIDDRPAAVYSEGPATGSNS